MYNQICINHCIINLPFLQVYCFIRYSFRISLFCHKTFSSLEIQFLIEIIYYINQRQLLQVEKQRNESCLFLKLPKISWQHEANIFSSIVAETGVWHFQGGPVGKEEVLVFHRPIVSLHKLSPSDFTVVCLMSCVLHW